jgi:glycosyltransferase involved in cell wall biosynthesis
VDSALAQDYPNLEIIVSDDASTDDTAAVIAARGDPRLRYHRNQNNLGRAGNYRNTLYHLATGEWVVNLDGDDYFTDNKFISSAIRLAHSDPHLLVVMATARIGGRRFTQQVRDEEMADIVDGLQALVDIALERRHFFHLATLYRRHDALTTDFYRVQSIDSDFESFGRLMLRGKVGFLDRDVGVWREHCCSESRTADWQELLNRLENLTTLVDMAIAAGLPRKRASPALDNLLTASAYHDLLQLLASGKCQAAGQYVIKFVVRYGPRSAAALGLKWRLYARFLRRCVLGIG